MSGRASAGIRVRQKLCNGCMSCQVYCATAKEGICATSSSRVRISLDPFGARHRISICRQCKDAPCAAACPENAIKQSEDGTYWAIDYSLCTTCKVCLEACKFDAIFYDPITDQVIKCDLCQGNPLCVQVCPTGALTRKDAQRPAE